MAAAARAAAAPAATAGRTAERRLRRGAVHREAGELLQDLRRTALRTRDRLVARADELIEVRLALHARVLVDRHAPSVLSRGVEVEHSDRSRVASCGSSRLRPEHEEALWLASRDARLWRWLPIVQPQTRDEWSAFFERALAAASDGTEMPFVTLRSGKVVGSTRFLAPPTRAWLDRDRLDLAQP